MSGKISLRLAVLAAVLLLAGCGRGISEDPESGLPSAEQEEAGAKEQEMLPGQEEEANETQPVQGEAPAADDGKGTSSFWFQMNTFYGDTDGNDFDGGYLQSGRMKTGDKAVLVKSDGTSYETSIQRIALYDTEDTIHPIPVTEAEAGPLTFVWLEGVESDQFQYGDMLLGTTEWEQGIPIEFPFEEQEEYSLTFAPQEGGEGSGELRLYDKEGVVLQRITYGVFTEPVYNLLCKNDRRNLVIFPDRESNAGRFLEWDGSRFLELETDLKGQTPFYDNLLLAEETETELVREIYRPHVNDKEAEIIRSYELNKETGELEIWDCLDKKSLFRSMVALDEEGIPVNREYYEVIFTEGLYVWEREGVDESVPVDICSLKEPDGKRTEYESREAFLSEYGFADSDPIYEYCDRLGNLRLELYRDEAADLFCGITYRYFYNNKKQKHAGLSGFVADDITEGEWEDDTYSIMSSIDSYGYEEEIKYTPDQKPTYFLAIGPDEIVSEEREIVDMMELIYIYRDDGTLYQRHYWHNPYQFSTYRQSETSLYDEKGRLVFENAYITHGHLEDYYIYLDGGNEPAYCVELDYAGGAAPNASMERYSSR